MPLVAYAGDERVITLKKKAGSAATNWAITDAAAPGAGDAMLVTQTVNPERQMEKIQDQGIGGEQPLGDPANAGISVPFQTQHDLRYEGGASHLPIAMALGTSGGAPTTPGGGTASRDQVFTPAININGIVATLAEGATASRTADQPSADIVPSAMCTGFELSSSAGGLLTCSADWVGIDVFQNPAPSEDPHPATLTLNHTLANIAAATLDADATDERIRHTDCKVYLDVEGGGDDFAANDDHVIKVGDISLAFRRDLDYPTHSSQEANALDGASRPCMPVNNAGLVKPTGTFQVLRYDTDQFKGRHFANTALRMRFEWTGSIIETTIAYRLRIDLPSVRFTAAPREIGGNTTSTISFDCYEAASVPTGFTSTDMFRIDIRNTQTSDIMA